MTNAQRRFLLAVAAAEGERQLVWNTNVISRCADAGYVTTFDASEGMRYSRWYMTAKGIAALEADA